MIFPGKRFVPFVLTLLSLWMATGHAQRARSFVPDGVVPQWLPLTEITKRLTPQTSHHPAQCEQSDPCPQVKVKSRVEKLSAVGFTSTKYGLYSVELIFSAFQESRETGTDDYKGLFLVTSAGEVLEVDGQVNPDGCGEGAFQRAVFVGGFDDVAILETIWDGWECASDHVSTERSRVFVVKPQRGQTPKPIFDFVSNFRGSHGFKDSDSGFLGYEEQSRLELKKGEPCEKGYSSCASLVIKRAVENHQDGKKIVTRHPVLALFKDQKSERHFKFNEGWKLPEPQFTPKRDFPFPKFIVDGPANLRAEIKGEILKSIPDKDEVTFRGCHADSSWIRVVWKNQEGWTSRSNLRNFDLRKYCTF